MSMGSSCIMDETVVYEASDKYGNILWPSVRLHKPF